MRGSVPVDNDQVLAAVIHLWVPLQEQLRVAGLFVGLFVLEEEVKVCCDK